MKIQDLLEITFLSKLSTNTEESHYAYLKSNANLEKNNYQHELYISNGEITRKALSLKEFSNYFWETNYTLLIPYSKNQSKIKEHIYIVMTLKRNPLKKPIP